MAKFSTTVDADVIAHLREASALAGHAPLPPTAPKGPKVFAAADGEQLFLSVFPVSRASLNPPVRVFESTDWPENVRKFIPAIDTGYVFPPEETLALAMAITHGDKALAHGPTGSGKTTVIEQICARLRMPFIRVNCKLDMESAALMGSNQYTPDAGVTYVEGPLPELARSGGVLCIDEISKMPSGITAVVMPVLEDTPTIYLADKPGTSEEKFIKPHKWFRVVCTDNTELQGDTTGKYVSCNVQDEAVINRFSTTVKLGYLSQSHEVQIILNKVTGTDRATATRMVDMANLIRQAYAKGSVGLTFSVRDLIQWARKDEFWGNTGKAFALCYFNKLVPADREVVGELYHSIFAENLPV